MNYSKKSIATALATITTASTSVMTSANVLEEIIVTAQKREQNLQDVGISVTAFSGGQLNALGFRNTTDIVLQVPGLQIQSFTPAFTAFNLRGISQNNFHDILEAPVAVYVDDAYVGSMNAINGQMFDMDRVEVLRGPQGTLFGRNATGGLIHYITNKATDEEINGYIEGTAGDYDLLSVEGAVGGAFSNKVRGRIAGRWEEMDGYVESQVGARDMHGKDGYAVRGNLQVDFSDTVTGSLLAYYSEDNDVPTGSYIVNGATINESGQGVLLADLDPDISRAEPHDGIDDGGFFDRDTTSVTGRLDWEINEAMNFVSITNVLDMDKYYEEDADGTVSADTGAFFAFITTADYQQWTQEFRFTGEADNLQWQVGAYYLDIDGDFETSVDENLFRGDGSWSVATSTSELESTNWSLFAQVEYSFTDAWTLIAGYRYSQDDKEIEFLTTDDSRNLDGTPDGTPPVPQDKDISDVDEIDYDDWAGRLQLNYTTANDNLFFISYNRGIKGGNWSPGRDIDLENFRHDEEVLHAYEIGTKLTLWDGKARLNATAFYYDYEDYQQFSLIGATPQVVNRDAELYGSEVELFLNPTDTWDISLGLSVIDSEADSAPSATMVEIPDVDLPNAPEYSVNALIRKSWPNVLNGEIAVQVDGAFVGAQYLEATNNPASDEDSYSVSNARISYAANAGWEIQGWVKNFTDEEYRMYHLDLGFLGFNQEVWAPPRTYGVTVNYKFGG